MPRKGARHFLMRGDHLPDPEPATAHDPQQTAEKWRAALADIPSRLGRLVYLSALLDDRTAHYEAGLLAEALGPDAARALIEQAQRKCFSEWLNLPLARQAAELELYLSAAGVSKPAVLRCWAESSPYRNLVPAAAAEVERQLFLCDLEIVVKSMAFQEEPSQETSRPVAAVAPAAA